MEYKITKLDLFNSRISRILISHIKLFLRHQTEILIGTDNKLLKQ